jgi:hypothetical protein
MVSPPTLSAAAGLVAAAAPAPDGAAVQRARPRSAASTGAARAGPPLLQPRVVAGLVGAVRAAIAGLSPSRAAAGWAPATEASSKAGPLSFLKDASLSIEEKLVRLLGYLSRKWEKEMQDKLDKIAAGEGVRATAARSSAKKKSGLLGSVTGALKGMLGPAGIALEALQDPAIRSMLGKVGGPVLAAAASAMGFPQLAPLLLKYGPSLVDAAASIGAAQATAPSGGSGSSSSGATNKMTDAERQTVLMEVQRIQQKQQEMFAFVSNVLKSGHELRSALINNIR